MPTHHSIDQQVTSVATTKLDSIVPPDATRSRVRTKRHSTITLNKSPVVIRGNSGDRTTFGLIGLTDNERQKILTPKIGIENRHTPTKVIRVNETTFNKTSTPLKLQKNENVTSKRIIVAYPKESERENLPKPTCDNIENVRTSRKVCESKVIPRKQVPIEIHNYDDDPQQIYDTKDTYSTIYSDRENTIELNGSCIEVSNIQKSRSRSPVVPRLNYELLKQPQGLSNFKIQKTYNTDEIETSQRVQPTPTNTAIVSGSSSKNNVDTSRFDTNIMMVSKKYNTPNIIRERGPNGVMKSPLRSPVPSKHNTSKPDLTGSSPYKYYGGTPNYIPGTATNRTIEGTRIISSPIRTQNGVPIPSNIVRASPYRVTQPNTNRVYTSSPYRAVRASPARVIASPSPIRTYGAPAYSHSPMNLTGRTLSRSPVRAPTYQTPIYTQPAYQHRPAPIAVRTPSMVMPTYGQQMHYPQPAHADNTITPSFRPPVPRSIYTPIYTDPKQHATSAKLGPVPPHENEYYQPPSSYKTPTQIEVIGGKKKVSRTRAKIVESVEADLSNPPQFFNNYQVGTLAGKTALDLGDTMANKLSMNDDGTLIYATGIGGTHVVGVNGPMLSKEDFRADRPGTTVECIRENDLIIQDPGSNDLYRLDGILGLERQIDGIPEGGKPIEDFHHYRHGLDYAYLLWRSGQDNLSIVDVETFECVDVIKQFWTFEKQSSMPVAACATVNADRILGTSQAGPQNYIVHYYEDTSLDLAFAKPVGAVFPSMYKLTCMDTSYDEKLVYIGGRAMLNSIEGGAVVIAAEFNDTLREVSSCLLTDLDYGTPHRLQRVSGTELIIVACDRHFAILDFRGGSLIQIARVANVHDNEITDFIIRGKFLYSKAFNEPLIKSTEFNTPGGVLPAPVVSRPTPVNNVSRGAYNYGNFNTQKFGFAGMDDLHKVAVSTDGQRVFSGGRGLHRFDTAGGVLRPIEIDTTKGEFSNLTIIVDINFFGIKTTSNKDLAIQEPTTNNMVVLSEALEFRKSEKGKQSCVFRKFQSTNNDDFDLLQPNINGEIQGSVVKMGSLFGSVELLQLQQSIPKP